MLYKSSYSDLQVLIRASNVMYHPVTGVEISRTPPLRANFGAHGGTFTATNPLTGELEEHAIINGNYFDTEAAAEANNWGEDEHDSVVASLDRLAAQQPYLLVKVDLTRPPKVAPWPTYDDTSVKEIVEFAIQLGLVAEALAYEKENLARPKIVGALEDHLAANTVPPELAGVIRL